MIDDDNFIFGFYYIVRITVHYKDKFHMLFKIEAQFQKFQ